jgi:hypothetical protein
MGKRSRDAMNAEETDMSFIFYRNQDGAVSDVVPANALRIFPPSNGTLICGWGAITGTGASTNAASDQGAIRLKAANQNSEHMIRKQVELTCQCTTETIYLSGPFHETVSTANNDMS